eukprot:gene4177-7487_t
MEKLKYFYNKHIKRLPKVDNIGMIGDACLQPKPNIYNRCKLYIVTKIYQKRYPNLLKDYPMKEEYDFLESELKKIKRTRYLKQSSILLIFLTMFYYVYVQIKKDQLEKRELYIKKKNIKEQILKE